MKMKMEMNILVGTMIQKLCNTKKYVKSEIDYENMNDANIII